MITVTATCDGPDMENKILETVKEIIHEGGKHAELLMKGMAPVLTGRLAGSIVKDERSGETVIGPHVDYAGEADEHAHWRGSSKWGKRGPHYLDRTDKQMSQDTPAIIQLVLNKNFGGLD